MAACFQAAFLFHECEEIFFEPGFYFFMASPVASHSSSFCFHGNKKHYQKTQKDSANMQLCRFPQLFLLFTNNAEVITLEKSLFTGNGNNGGCLLLLIKIIL